MNKLVALMFFVFITLLVGCSSDRLDGEEKTQESSTIKDSKSELILAIGSEPEDGFDPSIGWGRYGNPLFQSTLLNYNSNFEIEYDLAKSYEVSADGLEWTVKLRQDVKFSDGDQLDAADVVFTFETTKNSGSIIDLSNIDQIEATDDFTIKITLKEADSTFIYTLVTTGIVPEHAYDDTYKENPIGSGPYQLVQWDKGQQIIAKANPYYYGEQPPFEQVTFLFLSEDAAFAAAKSGDIDVLSVPSTFGKEKIDGMTLIRLNSVDNRGVMLPFLPSGKKTDDGLPIGNDVTADKAIRKAINVGVDREGLVDGVLNGFGTPAYSVADKLPWWNEETIIQDNDVELAKQILTDAGWQVQNKGIRVKEGVEAAFTLLYPAGDQIRQSLSLAFAEMIKPLGIHVTVEGKSWNEIERHMFSQPVMMGWGSHNPIEIYNLYSSSTRGIGYYNVNYYSNPKIDNYMDKAIRAKSAKEANTWWKKAQWDGEQGFSAKGDAPWVWLVNIDHLYFINEELEIGEQKVQPHGHGWPITDFILDWHWKE